MNRRASLSISTNAIVVLIIAVIMLGLIIGLVTRGFGAVEKKFLGQIEDSEPQPSVPSTSSPITLSRSAVFASPGELIGLKINLLNTGGGLPAGATKAFIPKIECVNEVPNSKFVIDPTTVQVIPQSLESGQYGTYLYLAKLHANALGGPQLCEVIAYYGDSGAKKAAEVNTVAGFPSAQFRIEVEN